MQRHLGAPGDNPQHWALQDLGPQHAHFTLSRMNELIAHYQAGNSRVVSDEDWNQETAQAFDAHRAQIETPRARDPLNSRSWNILMSRSAGVK